MSVKHYEIRKGSEFAILAGAQPRATLDKIRTKGYKIKKIKNDSK